MNVYVRAAFAVLVLGIGIVGVSALLNARQTSVGPPTVPPSPSPQASPTAGPRPTPYFGQMTASPLDGRADGFVVPFSYHLPDGAGLVAGQSEYGFYQFRVPVAFDQYSDGIVVRSVSGGRTDPCTEGSSTLSLGDSRAILEYLRTVPNVTLEDVTSLTLDGRPGFEVTFHVGDATADCRDLWLWDGVGSITQNGGWNADWRIWLVDVRAEIVSRPCVCASVAIYTGADAEWQPIAESFVQSLRFDSPRPSPTGG